MPATEATRLTARDRQRLETRQRLYETALQEFRSRGFDAVQVEDIVRAAGVARGTFYLHFQNKEDLLRAFRGSVEEQIRDEISRKAMVLKAQQKFDEGVNKNAPMFGPINS